MEAVSQTHLWLAVLFLGLVTYSFRFVFMGFMGSYQFPAWALRLLKYVPVTVLPALVVPGILWSDPSGASLDPLRTGAAVLTIAIGIWTRSPNWAFLGGLVALVLLVNWPF